MDADDLRIVEAVARNGSMNRAAVELNMVQSNVTSRVRHLEEELGVQLFIRHSRGVAPSDAGLRLLSYAQQILSLTQEAVAAVREDGIPKGHLRIGATETSVGLWLPQLAADYAQKYPEVQLAIVGGTTTSLINQVVERQIDGAFVSGPVDHQELHEEPIVIEELVLVTPLSVQTLDDIRSVENLKLIVAHKDCSYRQRLGSILDGMGIEYQMMEFSSMDAIITCVSAGVGITLLPTALVDHVWKGRSVRVHELPPDQAKVGVVFIRRLEPSPASALSRFLEMSHHLSSLASQER